MKCDKKQLLTFGYGLAVILTFVGTRMWMKHGYVIAPAVMAVFAAVLVVITASDWRKLIPFYKRWMKVVGVIGTVITSIILSVVFYGVFGVVGLALRLMGKDLLNRKIEPDKDSYWIKREKEEFSKERYTKQF